LRVRPAPQGCSERLLTSGGSLRLGTKLYVRAPWAASQRWPGAKRIRRSGE
jgi:hypothetical protein